MSIRTNNVAGHLWLMPVILKKRQGGFHFEQPGKIAYETPISKTTRAKWTGGVAQVIQHMLCKHMAEFKPQCPPTTHTQLSNKRAVALRYTCYPSTVLSIFLTERIPLWL
jgi:hypothetical protein